MLQLVINVIFIMKKSIHPTSHKVLLKFFEGLEFYTRSTLPGPVLLAEVNIFKHPAWQDEALLDQSDSVNQNVNKFKGKYGGINLYKINENGQ